MTDRKATAHHKSKSTLPDSSINSSHRFKHFIDKIAGIFSKQKKEKSRSLKCSLKQIELPTTTPKSSNTVGNNTNLKAPLSSSPLRCHHPSCTSTLLQKSQPRAYRKHSIPKAFPSIKLHPQKERARELSPLQRQSSLQMIQKKPTVLQLDELKSHAHTLSMQVAPLGNCLGHNVQSLQLAGNQCSNFNLFQNPNSILNLVPNFSFDKSSNLNKAKIVDEKELSLGRSKNMGKNGFSSPYLRATQEKGKLQRLNTNPLPSVTDLSNNSSIKMISMNKNAIGDLHNVNHLTSISNKCFKTPVPVPDAKSFVSNVSRTKKNRQSSLKRKKKRPESLQHTTSAQKLIRIRRNKSREMSKPKSKTHQNSASKEFDSEDLHSYLNTQSSHKEDIVFSTNEDSYSMSKNESAIVDERVSATMPTVRTEAMPALNRELFKLAGNPGIKNIEQKNEPIQKTKMQVQPMQKLDIFETEVEEIEEDELMMEEDEEEDNHPSVIIEEDQPVEQMIPGPSQYELNKPQISEPVSALKKDPTIFEYLINNYFQETSKKESNPFEESQNNNAKFDKFNTSLRELGSITEELNEEDSRSSQGESLTTPTSARRDTESPERKSVPFTKLEEKKVCSRNYKLKEQPNPNNSNLTYSETGACDTTPNTKIKYINYVSANKADSNFISPTPAHSIQNSFEKGEYNENQFSSQSLKCPLNPNIVKSRNANYASNSSGSYLFRDILTNSRKNVKSVTAMSNSPLVFSFGSSINNVNSLHSRNSGTSINSRNSNSFKSNYSCNSASTDTSEKYFLKTNSAGNQAQKQVIVESLEASFERSNLKSFGKSTESMSSDNESGHDLSSRAIFPKLENSDRKFVLNNKENNKSSLYSKSPNAEVTQTNYENFDWSSFDYVCSDYLQKPSKIQSEPPENQDQILTKSISALSPLTTQIKRKPMHKRTESTLPVSTTEIGGGRKRMIHHQRNFSIIFDKGAVDTINQGQ